MSSFDSLVRLRQLNSKELSGYILEVVGKIATGLQLTGSGVLTGAFYPRYENPSGYITGVNTGEFVTNYALAVYQDNLLANASGLFYLKSNPSGYTTKTYIDSGFIRVYPYANSGVAFVDDPSNTTVFSFREGSHFYIQSDQGKTIIDVSGTVFGAPAISGFAIHASSIKLNGQNVLTDSGDFISKTNDTNNTRLFLYDGIIAEQPFVFKQNSGFYLQGYDNSAIIDMYDSTRGGIRPYMSGFEVYATQMFISGQPVMTGKSTQTFVVTGSGVIISGVLYEELTGVSGELYRQIETVRGNLILTGQAIGPPQETPPVYYLTKDALAYSGKLYKSFLTSTSLFNYITDNNIKNYTVYVGTGNFGVASLTFKNIGTGNFIGLYDIPNPTYNLSLSFTQSTGKLYLSPNINTTYAIDNQSDIYIQGGYSSYNLNTFYSFGSRLQLVNHTGTINVYSGGHLFCKNSEIAIKYITTPFEKRPLDGFTGINCKILNVEGLSGANPYFYECIISGGTQLATGKNVPFLAFGNGGKEVSYPYSLYTGGGAFTYDGSDIWLVRNSGTGPLTYNLMLSKNSGDSLYYSSTNPNSYITANYVATFYAQLSDAALLNNTTHNTNFYLYNPHANVNHLILNQEEFTLYGTGDGTQPLGCFIDFNSSVFGYPVIFGFDKIMSNTLPHITLKDINGVDEFDGEPYISGFHIGAPTITVHGRTVITGADNIGDGYGTYAGGISTKLQFKSLKGGSGIDISDQTDHLLIKVTGINGGGGGVTSLNTYAGIISLSGAGNVSVVTGENNIIYISGTGGASILGLPTDGTYGGSNGPIAGVEEGDTPEDAFDKVEVILGKLAPAKPQNLSAASFILTGTTYTAIEHGTSTTRTGIQNTLRPTGYATGFYNADEGTLVAYINGNITGSRILTTSNDTGNYTGLGIYVDRDFWSGVVGREGFWSFLNAKVTPTGNLNSGIFTMQLSHSETGPSNIITGYCDVPATPSVTISGVVTGACTRRIIDGVWSMAAGDTIGVHFTLSNAVSAFYRSTVANVDSTETTSVNVSSTGTPTSGQNLRLAGITAVESSRFITGWIPSVIGYNSIGSSSSTATLNTNIRIDTNSTQPSTRYRAGSGRYPTSYGATYNNDHELTKNEELQLINTYIQYPPRVNYTSISPPGPDYSNINTGSFNYLGTGYRWSCFSGGTISSDSSITVTFNGAANFGSSAIANGLFLYVKVDGSNPTNGWIDGNAAYGGVGNPTNDGDAALVVGSSSSTLKVITFGTATRDGVAWIRVGIPSGSNKYFQSITMS